MPLRRVLTIALLSLSLSVAFAEIVEQDLDLETLWLSGSPEAQKLVEVLENPDLDRFDLPRFSMWWALEAGEIIESAEIVILVESQEGTLAGNPQHLPLVSNEGSEILPAEGPLWRDSYRLLVSSPRILHGRRYQSMTLCPLRLEDGDEIMALRDAQLRLVIGEREMSVDVAIPQRPDFPLRERTLELIGDRLLNPELLPTDMGRAVGGEGFPTDAPSLDGSEVEMVIVTVDSFIGLCENYAETKTAWGIPTVARSLSWIESHYPHGSDRPEMIRAFAKDAYEKWSIKYLLIVGDIEEVPIRFAYSTLFVEPTTTPTDLYYACLDGNWNADLDSYWCEVGIGEDLGDEADLVPEVFTGRLPAGSYTECETMLAKSQSAQDCSVSSYQNQVLLLGEVLFPQEWNYGDEIHIDGADYCEYVTVNASGPGQELTRLYENYYAFPGSEDLTRASTLAELQAGPSIVLHNGHGGRQNMSVGDGSLNSSDIEMLSNQDQLFMLYMVNCTAAAFEYSSLAESYLENPNGGSFAVIGSTGETYSNISVNYQNVFFQHLFEDPTIRLGELYANSLIAHDVEAQEDSGFRWAHQTFALLGDPSSWVRYELLETPVVSFNSSYEAGSGPLTFTVQNEAMEPWPGIRVTISKGDEDYHRGMTDLNGEVIFQPLPETSGIYIVRVDARDGTPWQGLFTVTMPGASEYLSIAEVSIDDLSDGSVIGNNNGVAEAGETVRLNISLQNEGGATAAGISAALSTTHAEVVILDGSDAFADIPSGQNGSGTDGYLIQLADFGDDEILPFQLLISSAVGDQDEEFYLESAATDFALFRCDMDDSVGGDGDGDIQVGETVELAISIVNWGRAMAPDLQASLVPNSPSGVSVLSGDIDLDDVSGLSGELGPIPFTVERISETSPSLLMILTDANGQVDTLDVLLERPAVELTAPSFEFTTHVNIINLHWEPAGEGEVAGYRVERSEVSDAGPFAEVTPDWTEASSFEDTDLQPLSVYWYRIIPLSESLLPGIPSPVSEVTTNPALKSGWPREMEWSTPSTPLIVDLDDDGDLEVLVGNKELYGYFYNGDELSDGDYNDETTGPLSYEGERYDAALSAGDIIPGGGLEVAGASWNSGEIVVWEFTHGMGTINASVADGWPQDVVASSGIWTSPSLGDVDGDGDLEIFVVDIYGTLMAWHHDGSEVIDGDDDPGTHGIFATGLGAWPRGTPSFADIDRDGAVEIFVPSENGDVRGYWGDGSNLPGFPFVYGGNMYSSLAIGDLDQDGHPELVFHTSNDSLYIVDHDGQRHEGWPIPLMHENYNYWMSPSPALADITGDAGPEIFITSMIDHDDVDVGFIDLSGGWLPGWPVRIHQMSQSSPVIVDLDGDSDLEVAFCNESGEIRVWHHDGQTMAGFPIVLGEAARATPTFGDLDGDGFLDMVYAGWDRNLYVWELPAPFSQDGIAWYTFQHDQLRTGWTRTYDWIIGELVGVDGGELPEGAVLLDGVWPNPFNPSTSISFTLGEGDQREVKLGIYDAGGRRLALLVDEGLDPGSYILNWNGHDDRGREMPSGIYFARLSVDRQVESKKMTLLK